jgi:hypothetical protein
MPEPRFAICRAEKVKDPSALSAMSGHQARTRVTPNADPERANLVLTGTGDPARDALQRIEDAEVRRRKNGVLAIELVLTASPAFFRPDAPERAGTWDEERLQAWAPKALRWAGEWFGRTNVSSAILHLDEATPHMHVVVVPIDDTPRQRGPQKRLNAARWLDGREKLARMQDSYASAMADLGLERGIKGRRVSHQKVATMYAQLARDSRAAADERQRAQDVASAVDAFADGRWRVHEGVGGAAVVEWRSEADRSALEPVLRRSWPAVGRWALRASQGLQRRVQSILSEVRAVVDDAMQLAGLRDRAAAVDHRLRSVERSAGVRAQRDGARRGRQRGR